MQRAEVLGWAAAGVSALWFLVHTFVGGPEVATPLIASDLPEVVRVTGWMVWNMTTAHLALMAALFGWATHRRLPDTMLAATAMAAATAAGGIVSAFTSRSEVMVIPQGFLFVPVVALGWAAWRALLARPVAGL